MPLQDPAVETERRLVVSPHLDDAVLSCGELIASSHAPVVLTVFAGPPPAGTPLPRWDADCGFAAGDDAVAARRDEDRQALSLLGAQPIWLDFVDDQYGVRADEVAIVDGLAGVVERMRPSAVLFPLGMFHADHVRASDAALAASERIDGVRWYAYEDALYRRIEGAVDARAGELGRRGFALTTEIFAIERGAHARKREAILRYRSQIKGLASRAGYDDALLSEKTWRVSRQAA